jgi:hypothetical protein
LDDAGERKMLLSADDYDEILKEEKN